MPGPKIRRGEKKTKKSSFKFGPIFCPKLGKEQKKRYSLEFGPIFCPKLGEEQKKVFTQIWSYRGRWGELDTEVVNCTLLENACRYKNRFGTK